MRAFQRQRGLEPDGICGADTWGALVESGFVLGERLLVLQRPLLRGDDVAELQRRLGRLGFDPGGVDGIFGPGTNRAVAEFQHNAGLVADGIFGPDSHAALARLGTHSEGDVLVGGLRAGAAVRTTGPRRIVLAEDGGLGALAAAVRRHLLDLAAHVLVVHHPDGSTQASQANRYGCDLFVGFRAATTTHSDICYYATDGFVSTPGRRLADELAAALSPVLARPVTPRGMRVAVLRETRMPAVVCRLAPLTSVIGDLPGVGGAVRHAVGRWSDWTSTAT